MKLNCRGGRGDLTQRKRKVCLLISGGYDSCALLCDLLSRGVEVHPIYIRSGFTWERAELHWLRRFLRRLKRKSLKPLAVADAPLNWAIRGHWSMTGRGVPDQFTPDEWVYLPGRNLSLLTQAGLLCALRDIKQVALATLSGNPFSDAKPRFLRAMATAMSLALNHRVSIVTPLSRARKGDLARRLPRDFPAELTFSCIKPVGLKPCGRCNKCSERRLISRDPRS